MHAENLSERMPGDAEAAAAIAAMQDTYGGRHTEHAVGDWITWHGIYGMPRSGGIIECRDDGYVVVGKENLRYFVTPDQIARV
jgi:hypothetical protein